MKNRIFKINAAQSQIDWKGWKLNRSHNGTIAIKEGSLVFNDGILTGGQFIIDATSIKVLDVSDAATNAQFVGHMLSNDFFAAEQYPEASFVITVAEKKGLMNYSVKGDLTIKGITHSIAFNPKIILTKKGLSACGRVMLDRTWYGMKFRSGNFFKDLENTLICDEIELDFDITAKEIPEPAGAMIASN